MSRGNAAIPRESAGHNQRRNGRDRHAELLEKDIEENERYAVANDELEEADHRRILTAKQPEQQGEHDREQN